MKISIIIPTYNCAEYLPRAIESVLNQPYKNKELIVIDGDSTDETKSILESYGEQLTWVSEKDTGQADAINKGFKIANGDILAWLNADDFYEKDILNDVVNIFENDPKTVIVYGNCTSQSINTKKQNIPSSSISTQTLLNRGNLLYQPSTFYRGETVYKVGSINTSLTYWMEYDLYIKLLKNGEAKYINKNLAYFTIHPNQKSNSKNQAAMDKELLEINRRYVNHRLNRIFVAYWLRKLFK